MVTSTTLLIGRTPQARRRRCIHCGETPTLTPVITAPMYRLQRSGASIRTSTSSVPGGSTPPVKGGMKSLGSLRPSAAASSLATPRWLRLSGRLGVTSTSRIASLGMISSSRWPGVPSSSSMIPSWSSESRSSAAEHSIPWASSPAILPSRTRVPLGTVVPGSATATTEPGTALDAPAMI